MQNWHHFFPLPQQQSSNLPVQECMSHGNKHQKALCLSFFLTRNQQIQFKVFAYESERSRIHTFQPLEIGGAQLVDAPGSVRVAVVPAELLQELLALRHLPPTTPQIPISSSETEQLDQIKLGENLEGAILLALGFGTSEIGGDYRHIGWDGVSVSPPVQDDAE